MFKTAFELDQRWVIEHAADRAPLIDQAQSLNIFLPANVHKRDLHQIHYQAWKKGVKSLYYCRSKSIQRAEVVANREVPDGLADLLPGAAAGPLTAASAGGESRTDYEECLACQ